MQNKQNKQNTFESLLPPVPESYRARMEETLAALPVETASRTVSVRSFTKKQMIILIAALVTLLTVGTAFAVGISRMQEMRDEAQKTIADYESIVNGSGGAETALNNASPTPYVILENFETDENGEWRPNELDRLDVSDTVGAFTIRLVGLSPNYGDGHLMADIRIEADHAQPYSLDMLRLSVNGSEPIRTVGDSETDKQWSCTPTPCIAEEWFNDNYDIVNPIFALSGNPLQPGMTFEITGTLNGETFNLTYDFSREAYETLKAEQLDSLDAISTVLSDIPDDVILVNKSVRGEVIEEIALKDHFLYVLWHYDREYRTDPNNSDRLQATYKEYDKGIHTTVDGMLSFNDFISSTKGEDGENHQIHRAYFPYDGVMPDESLIGFGRSIFRVNWKNKTVTAPKDDAEYDAWRKESAELSSKDYGTDFLAKPEIACDSFKVKEMIYLNKSAEGQLAVILETDEPVKDALHGRDRQPVVTVNGVTLENEITYIQDPNDFCGGSKNGGKLNGFWLYCPAYRTLPETFEVTVSWRGDTVTFTMHKSDFAETRIDVLESGYKALLGF